jgi:hypothetical protein
VPGGGAGRCAAAGVPAAVMHAAIAAASERIDTQEPSTGDWSDLVKRNAGTGSIGNGRAHDNPPG